MIDIVTKRGDNWRFDPDTKRLFLNGAVVPDTMAVPIYVNVDKTVPPEFSGIYHKPTNTIISISGNINKIEPIE